MKKILLLLISTYLFFMPSFAAFTSSARSFYLIDYQSGKVIAEKAGEDLMPPSSMQKLMTAELVFRALKDGELKLTDKLTASKNSDYKNRVFDGASKVCLSTGQTITVEDALNGLIVVSGGDVAILFAERLAGSEKNFIDMMTKRARELGMEYTSFGNSSGLPNADNLSTSRELAILARHIYRMYPEYAHFFKVRRFEFVNPISDFCRSWIRSHTINYNKLLFIIGGAGGMKTGHTKEGGYGIVASSTRGGRRMIGIINGMPAKGHDALASEAKRLLEFGYNTTFNKEIKAEVAVPLWYGKTGSVLVAPKYPFVLTFDKGTKLDDLRVTAIVPKQISAPVKMGDEIGKIVATLDGTEIKSEKLFATQDAPRVRFFGRVFRNIKYFITGR